MPGYRLSSDSGSYAEVAEVLLARVGDVPGRNPLVCALIYCHLILAEPVERADRSTTLQRPSKGTATKTIQPGGCR